MSKTDLDEAGGDDRIAVIGMAVRFPGAADAAQFWKLLERRGTGIQRVGREDLEAAGLPPGLMDDPDYVPAWGGPPEADGFDAAFFGYSPREAELMDPQQRMFLECAWSALEDAGHGGAGRAAKVGVYAGSSLAGHLLRLPASTDPFEAGLANIAGMVAMRTSFHLDLRGPSVGVQTTCSSALVAVHQAMEGLRRGECDIALAGAVAVNQPRPEGYRRLAEGIGAPDGICRPFDAEAAGTVFTNGAGVVVLRRLGAALAGGDAIRGVLLGSAVNNDGAGKVSITAPSVAGQAAALSAALAAAGLGGGDIDYVEAHGTGTALGDPIELAALNRAYGPGLAAAGRRCLLGSAKGNVGHLDAAAGMAGLSRILLAFGADRLPGAANFSQPNPKCAFGRFDVLVEGRDWPRDPQRPRRAGLSSFGIGGTNAHLLIEEPPAPEPEAPGGATEQAEALPISAATPEALARLAADLADALAAPGAPPLSDAAFTLQTGRRALAERRVVVAASRAEAVAALRAGGGSTRPMPGAPSLAFLFPGQGSQRPGMARGPYGAEPAFRAALDECLALVPPELELRALLLDPVARGAERIHETRLAQPALFVFEMALARLWLSRGLRPVALLGHSVGEFAAACLAGVFDLEDAVRIVCARGALMQACAPGAMLAVTMSEAEARGALPDGVEIAAVNGPRSLALSGPSGAIAALAERLDESGIGCRALRVSHAFHSAMMEPALDAFREAMAGIRARAPAIGVVSNVTGDWLTEAEAADPAYWARQLREPVRFGDGVAQLMRLDDPLLVEIGPGAGLSRLARQQTGEKARAVASLPEADPAGGAVELLRAAGEIWAAGAEIDWRRLHDGPRRRTPLPTYPFERRSFWLPPRAERAASEENPADPADWHHQPVWRRLPAAEARAPARRLVLGRAAIAALGGAAEGAILAAEAPGGGLERNAEGFALDPAAADQHRALLAALADAGEPVEEIVCGWGLDGEGVSLFEGAAALLRALAETGARARLALVGAGMQEVTGREALDPAAAMALGLAAAAPHEAPGLECRAIDLDPAELGGPVPGLAEALGLAWREAGALAVRGGHVWRCAEEATPMRAPEAQPERAGPLLVVGDLAGGLAHVWARAVREEIGAPLILAGRGLPEPARWDGWLATHGPGDPTGRLIALIRGLGEIGRDILVLPGDDGDAGWLGTALDEAEARLGPIAGVLHSAPMGDESFLPLAEADAAAVERLVGPRLRGVAALRRVLAGRAPAFCLVQSSLSVLAGGHGFAAYAAANARIEAEVLLARRDGGARWQAARWDVAETGSLGEAGRRASTTRALSADEVWRAARAVIARPGAALVTVTPMSLARRLKAAADTPARTPDAPRRPASTPYVAPRDEYETAVAALLSEMLGVPEVGAEDNFFELGGHSLLAIQIVNRLRRRFDVALPVRALLYEAPTVAGVAGAIRKAREETGADIAALGRLLDEFEDEREEKAG